MYDIRYARKEDLPLIIEFLDNHWRKNHALVVSRKLMDFQHLNPITGDYNFTNICAAVSLGLHFEIDFEEIKAAIENYKPTNMRSQVVEKNGKTLVLDTYNANPSSMALSLNNFSQFTGSKTVIIGDMLELGEESITEHQKIWELAQSLN